MEEIMGTYWKTEQSETAWNDLQWPEMTYNEQETTWNNLKWPTRHKL